MAEQPRILIAGGTGVFGRLLARELLSRRLVTLLVAGRDIERTAAVCRSLSPEGRAIPLQLDLRDLAAFERAARGCLAVACTAGPFQSLPAALPAAALAAGASWLDIADDPDWVLPLLQDSAVAAAAERAGAVVMPGLSTVPSLSGVLVRRCLAAAPAARRARITLFIGNRNAKGSAAVASVLRSGLRDPRPVALPNGRRLAYRFPSPDAALLLEELAITAETRVAFEWDLTGRLLTVAHRLMPRGSRASHRLAAALAGLATPFGRLGSEGGCLQAEVWGPSGAGARVALLSRDQRLAILPCALAVEALLAGALSQHGVPRPTTWLPQEQWVARLQERGIRILEEMIPAALAAPAERTAP